MATLTAAQRRFFDTFGYLAFPGLFADRVETIIEQFEGVFTAKGGGHYGKPHDGKARSCIVPFVDQNEYLSALIDHPRIDGICTDLLGEDYNYLVSDGNYYVGNTGWHSDSYWQKRGLHIKLAFYLDPVDENSGCLRVIPGSHRIGEGYAEQVNAESRNPGENWGVAGEEVPCMPLRSKPGDVLLFNHDLKHASFHGAANRRMFTINFCQRYQEAELPQLRDYIGTMSRFWIDRVFGEPMIRTATPQRMRHLEQIMANDGHLAALSAKARETMPEPSRG
ncbi:MAG: phytanoyl-CoA dioxygenase family protein [Planctomycetota bacterium]|nr:phytanoyl-CoA dioxygenase family protein [Planctomycetota bacterium]